jgi:hypothetical protein
MFVHSNISTGLGQSSAMVLTETLTERNMKGIKHNNYFHPLSENK